MKRLIAFAIVILTILYHPPVTDAVTIKFDEGGPASIALDQTTALRDEYTTTSLQPMTWCLSTACPNQVPCFCSDSA